MSRRKVTEVIVPCSTTDPQPANWVRGDLGRYAESVWRDSGAERAGYLEPASVARLFDEHRAGRADRSQMLYALAMFALWWSARPR